MARTLNFRKIILFVALPFLMLVRTTTALAQNVIVNGDFEAYYIYGAITSPSYTDYQRVNANYVVESGHYVINTTTSGHGGGQGWPMPSNPHGKFMIVNGYGGNTNPTKVVWRQTVNVTTQTNYTFSYRYVNLNRVLYGQIRPSKLQVKINGIDFGAVNTLPSDNNWHDWNNNGVQWPSGNATQAMIEIFDTYTELEGLGDDFCLDDISFVPDVVYSVDAINDNVSACMGEPETINVLGNDVFQPNQNDATVTIVTNPSHGTATVSNRMIIYTFSGGNFTTDQLKYRVSIHGATDEAWVYINVGQTPVVGNISNQGPICTGSMLNISTPSVNPNISGQWMYSSSQNGTYQPFDPNNIPISMNGKWVRYSASNDCGEGHSNSVQITVTNGPTWASGSAGQTPQIQPICAGQSLTLTPPSFSDNGSQILDQGWVASPTENGQYNDFSLNNINASYNGWYIRYMVEGSCGYIYSSPARLLTVNVAPSNVSALAAPDAICAGDNLEVVAPTYDGTGTGAWEICQTQNGTYQSFSITNVPRTYDGWYLHYKVSNNCGSVTSNYVQIHVNDAPTIATPDTPTAICAGQSFTLTTPNVQSNGFSIDNAGWQISATQNGTYNTLNNNNIPYSYNGYWIRYFAENECDITYSPSVQVTVNDEPLVGNITAPAGICAGGSFNLTTPQVTWRHNNMNTCSGSWQIQINGVWQTLNNNNIPYAYNGCNLRYKAVNGCGEAYSANMVQVTVYSTDPIDEGEITACDAIYHHGVYCDHNWTYVADSITPDSCTIQVSWNFTLSEAYTETQTRERCESYTWPKNGQTYYASCTDTYTYESTDPLICDSIFTLVLTINNAPVINGDLQIGSSEICVGELLNVTEPQYQMNHAGGGRTRWDYATSANGPFHAFEPTTYHLEYGDYYIRFAVINDCDSTFSNVVQVNVNDSPIVDGHLESFQVCEDNPLDLPNVSVQWMNQNVNDRYSEWQMSATQNGTYAGFDPSMPMQQMQNGCWVRFMARTSCGEVYLGPVRVTVISVEDVWQDEIDCDTVWYEGVPYMEDVVVDEHIDVPCPHVVHHNIIVNHSNRPENDPSMIEIITSCHDEFEWHGHIYYRADGFQMDRWTTVNQVGCDSIRELRLDFGEYAIITETPQNYGMDVCDEFYWPRNDSTYRYDPQNPYIFDNVFIPGDETVCDSMIYLEFTMGRTWEIEGDQWIECSGFVWDGVTYNEDATIYEVIPTQGTNCDSIISHQLTILQPYYSEFDSTQCQPIWWHGHNCDHEDDYVHTFQSVQGCDSIVTMHFTFSEATHHPAEVVETCQHSYLWHGNTYTENGTYYDTIADLAGCDDIYMLELTFREAETMELEATACDQYPWPWVPSGYLTESGEYSYTLQNEEGCDSLIIRLNLTINHSETTGMIEGSHNVYVASNLLSGIYRYEIDPTGIVGDINWSISNSDWRIVESQDNYCRLLVTTQGSAVLTARFHTSCGEMERHFEINAGFFGVDEHGVEVNVYPNPTKGIVTVEAEGIESVRLINMMGQTLMRNEYNRSDSVGLSLSGLVPSVYLLEIKTVNGEVKRLVVLQR